MSIRRIPAPAAPTASLSMLIALIWLLPSLRRHFSTFLVGGRSPATPHPPMRYGRSRDEAFQLPGTSDMRDCGGSVRDNKSTMGIHRVRAQEVPAEMQISLSSILPTSSTEQRQNSSKRSVEVRTFHVRQTFVSRPVPVSKRFLIGANLPPPNRNFNTRVSDYSLP